MVNDMVIPDRWVLSLPLEVEAALVMGEYQSTGLPLPIQVAHAGKALDLGTTALGVWIATEKAAALLQSVAPDDVQRIPAHLPGRDETYEVIDIVPRLDCLDPRSVVDEGPPYAGGLVAVVDAVIDAGKVGHDRVFRLSRSPLFTVVDDRVRSALTEAGVVGPTFLQLTVCYR